MKLDVTSFRYITKDEFRVLTAVEMAMKNHELAPVPLIESIAKGNRGLIYKILQSLLRNKLIAHDGKQYDGYRLTYHGYDYLAIRALVMRGTITGVGRRLGVGKESDVHFCQGADGEILAIKLHRLGRISFRNIKEKRDYLQHRQHASWMYMARLAAVKEFAYMKALKDEGFPVPKPVDQNRHCVVMSYVNATPLHRMRSLQHPHSVLERLMRLIVRLAHAGIIHGDFNEFNLMIDADEKAVLIDFPQIVHLSHENAEELFDRDTQCVCDFFRKRINIEVEKWPIYKEVLEDIVAQRGGSTLAPVVVEGLDTEADALLLRAHADGAQMRAEGGDDEDDEGSQDDAKRSEDEEQDATSGHAFQKLMPTEGREALGNEDDVEVTGDAEGVDDLPAEVSHKDAGEDDDGDEASSGSDVEEDRPGQVTVSSGKRRLQRRQVTAKEARKNLQKQQKQRPARANHQKNKDFRKAKHEVKEWLG
jgi:RIO kinase 2